jgi:hypothetical protein
MALREGEMQNREIRGYKVRQIDRVCLDLFQGSRSREVEEIWACNAMFRLSDWYRELHEGNGC